jgi:hypothetical protein
MRRLFYLFLVLFLFGCEDIFKDTSHYSQRITQSKEYPVYLDMSEIGNIQVKANSPLVAPFKILSNDKYYFVGDMLKGIHVYEKKAAGVSYLCFIECRYINDFELADNKLFCNNLVDLVVVDVSSPMKINILHRQKNHFNRFTSYKKYWNLPYEEGKGLIAGTEKHELTGMVTDKQPNLDFSKLDQLYSNLTTKVVPNTWFSNSPENERPYPGMVKIGTDEVYTYGSYNSWAISSYRSGSFSVREEDLWTTPAGKYAPPYYYSNAYPVRMFFEDNMIFILGTELNLKSGYCDCIIYENERRIFNYHLYFPDFNPLDITYSPTMQAFFVLSGKSVWGAFKHKDPPQQYMERYIDYKIPTEATSIFWKENKVVTIGNGLSVYLPSENELKLVKNYPGISGKCCKKEGNLLTVANTQGLFLYDISDLENIQLIP